LVWDDFCSWYLEWVKPGFEQPIDAEVYESTVQFFEELVQLLHPFMPFVTEEIYHRLRDREDDLCVRQFAPAAQADKNILQQGDLLKKTISAIRDARVKNNIKPKTPVTLHIQSSDNSVYSAISSILSRQVNAESIGFVQDSVSDSIAVVVDKDRFYLQTEAALDTSAQREQLMKDLEYLKGFLVSVEKKLGNERFVQNAKPEVVEVERRKKADAEEKIKAIEESLASL
jgi:valyl-tRNA synthetase